MQDSLERLTDSDLVQRFRDGDEQAFDVLYGRYRLPLYAYLGRLVGAERGKIDDLYQQTWIRFIESIERYQEKQRFAGWLFRIAHNIAVDNRRREARIEPGGGDHDAADQAPPVWENEDRDNLTRELFEAIDRLPPEQREVVLLRQQDVPFKEIAKIQNVSLNTALGRMHYSVMRLRKELQHLL